MPIGLSRMHFPVTTLGPGRRVGIWFQGCSIRCPGCISMDTWRSPHERTSVEEAIDSIRPWLSQCDGVTISGGEPFDQPDELRELLQALHQEWPERDVLVYSGHTWDHLQQPLRSMVGLIDALMSEPFELRQPQTLRIRGSDNQRLHLLTERGRIRFREFDRILQPEDKTLDIAFDDDGTVWMAGVPLRRDLQRLKDLLERKGHRAFVSEQRME